MKLLTTILFVFPFLFFTSCSSGSWSDLFKDRDTDERNQELMEDFGAEGEVLEKFSEKKEESSPKKKAPKKKAVKASKTTSNKKVPNKLAGEKAKASKKASEAPVVKKSKAVPKKETQAPKKKLVYKKAPSDYPKDLKKINSNVKSLWKQYSPIFFPGETIVMDINYMGISTGKIVLTTERPTTIGDQKVYHARARLKTSDYYSYLYELDDSIDSYTSMETHTPVKFSLIQRESGQDIDDLQLFDLEKLKTYSFYKRVTDEKTKKKKEEKYTPIKYTDPLSVIWFLRGLPMDKGKVFNIPIMNRGKVIILKTKNDGPETIDTEIGKQKAYRMTATTSYTGETLKSGDMTFWFSADDRRIFLKFKAKIKIGSISGEIEKFSK